MPVFDDPNASDRVLAAEIYTRRIRNTVFGAILLVAWLILLFKDLFAGLAVGVAAGLLYGLFLLARRIVRLARGKGSAASRSAPATHMPWRIEPTSGRAAAERSVEGLKEVEALLNRIEAMPEGTRAERDRKGQALATGFGMALTTADQLRTLVLLAGGAAVAAWPAIANWVLSTSLTVSWWYIGIGAVLMFGGVVQLAEFLRGPRAWEKKPAGGDLIMILILAAVGAWAVFAHPLMGTRDPLTAKIVNPILGAFGVAPKVDNDGWEPVSASQIPC
jgi:hypothetical protein